MNINILSVKYSIFGNYGYIENTPENVSSLFCYFGGKGFVPNIYTCFQIDQQQNIAYPLERSQLVNKVMPCDITILPDRVDIEMRNNINHDSAIEYIKELINLFDIKINRIALYKVTMLECSNDTESLELLKKFAPPENFKNEDNMIEYYSRRVSRKVCTCFDEMMNVVRSLTGYSTDKGEERIFDKLQIDTDINTLAECTKDRFNFNQCCGFFRDALICDQNIIDNIMEIINES